MYVTCQLVGEQVYHQLDWRRRGPNINKKASQIVENQPDARIKLTRDTYIKKFIGDSATCFATEVGFVMRSFCQWNSIHGRK